MTTFNDLEDNLKSFIIQEQSDAHNTRGLNTAKYNNLKMWMDNKKYLQPHIFIRISISEGVFSLNNFTKMNGSLGYEERFVQKWFNRMGIKEKLLEMWGNMSREVVKEDK